MSRGDGLGEWSGWPNQAKDMLQISHGFCRLRRSVCVDPALVVFSRAL